MLNETPLGARVGPHQTVPASGLPSSEDLSTRSKLAAPAGLSEAWAEELSFTGKKRVI